MSDPIGGISKKLSWLLRHGAPSVGVAMDAAGWVAVDDVLRTLKLSRSTLEQVVEENNKSRLELDGDRVRASQGHSREGMPVTVEALEASWTLLAGVERVWHGTSVDALAGIASEGIHPARRTHVHLAEALESRVGKRANVDVMLAVSTEKLRLAGIGLFRSANGVVLARRVPPDCIVQVKVIGRRGRERKTELRALFPSAEVC
jgi:putative RNA 2'-phosphotransferase